MQSISPVRTFVGTSDLWNGLVNYRRSDLERVAFPTLRIRRARVRRLLGTDIAFGRMEVGVEGISWHPNRWLSMGFAMAKGSFQIPWSEVAEVNVKDAPGKVSSLGGIVTIMTKQNGESLSGEFLGSQQALRQALARGTLTAR